MKLRSWKILTLCLALLCGLLVLLQSQGWRRPAPLALEILRPAKTPEGADSLSRHVGVGCLFLVEGSATDEWPEGWLPCDGRTLLRSDYPGLGEAIGETYSRDALAGDRFALPDFRGVSTINVLPGALPWPFRWLSDGGSITSNLHLGPQVGLNAEPSTIIETIALVWLVKAK